MNKDVLKELKSAGLLSEEPETPAYISTGSYALNHIITRDFNKGIPVGKITQFIGEASTAKTVFVTHILKDAQRKGYYAVLIDSENAYNADFASTLGINPKDLIYGSPETIEDCFNTIEEVIDSIRAVDKDTPIVIGYDSLAVSPSKAEYESETYEGSNMDGAIRAKVTGQCLRKINPKLAKTKTALVIINQIRSKVGVLYGSPETAASGGKSLEYYLSVNMKTVSNKTSDLIRNEAKDVIGIQGKLKNLKNKESIPFRETEFELIFDKGLNPWSGVLGILESMELITRNGGWYTITGTDHKFQKKNFTDLIADPTNSQFDEIRKLFDLNLIDYAE